VTEAKAARRRVRVRTVGALMIIEDDDAPPPAGNADHMVCRAVCAPSTPVVHVDVNATNGARAERPRIMRLVLPRSELEDIARLRNLQCPSQPVQGHVQVPELLRIGSIAIVGLADVARRAGIAAPAPPPARVAQARDFVHRHWNQRLRASEISDAVGIHRVHLAREFRRWFQVPIMTYAYDLRMENAVRALATTTKSAATVAAECGFADQSHLTRRFAGSLRIAPSLLRALTRRGWSAALPR
jgi:AraC-like DNA-binding protein